MGINILPGVTVPWDDSASDEEMKRRLAKAAEEDRTRRLTDPTRPVRPSITPLVGPCDLHEKQGSS